MKYKQEINFLKTTMMQQSQIIMELQKVILAQNTSFSERFYKIEEEIKELASENVEEATSPGHLPGELKTPIQEKIGKSDLVSIDGISYA